MNEMIMRRDIKPAFRYIVCVAILMCVTTAMATVGQVDGPPAGLAVMEAENYDAIDPANNEFVWGFYDSEFAEYSAEGYMQTLPKGTNVMSDLTRSPRLDYDVKISQPGTLYIWARVLAPATDENSIHLGASEAITADRVNVPEIGEWVWKNVANNGDRAQVVVDASGLVTINCWMRESGCCVDKLLLTSDADYVPEGEGPVETGVSSGIANSPSPSNDSMDVLRDSLLSWAPGEFAASHTVYFSHIFSDVNERNASALAAEGLDVNELALETRLDFGETYFWAVDEVNGAPDYTVFPGEVWSFTAEPYSIQIAGSEMIVSASSFSNGDSMPEKTLDGSGLGENETHGIATETMWFTAMGDMDPWIQYEFDDVKKLDTMKIWNSNSSAEGFIGYGVKQVKLEYSLEGEIWDIFEDVNELSRAPGAATYNQYDEIAFGGVAVKMVRLNIQDNWGGFMQAYSLGEVQFNAIPAAARTPDPESGSTGILPNAVVSWRAGREADQSIVYVSTDPNEVAAGIASSATANTHGINLSAFEIQMGETYYWRVDEVNNAETVSVWVGPVWSLTIVDAVVVDDFESYNNISPGRPFQAWLDGFGYSADEFFPAGYGGNGTGSGVGHDIWTASRPHYNGMIMETDNTLPDSGQSLPFYYNNAGNVASQIERVFAVSQDWTMGDAQSLVLSFYGDPGNTGQFYVKINNTKIVYGGPANAITTPYWTQWNIDLSTLGNLQNVLKLIIGVDGNAASGKFLIDDILLFREAPMAASEQIWLEAESAALTEPMQAFSDKEDASGGSYIGTDDAGVTGDQSSGVASFTFTVQGGTYKINVRVIAGAAGDSFWVRLPGSTMNTIPPAGNNGWVRWNGIPAGESWHWDDIHNDEDGSIPVHFTLTAGTHTLEIGYREDGAFIDAIVITDQL